MRVAVVVLVIIVASASPPSSSCIARARASSRDLAFALSRVSSSVAARATPRSPARRVASE
jgi:hypothetical protein